MVTSIPELIGHHPSFNPLYIMVPLMGAIIAILVQNVLCSGSRSPWAPNRHRNRRAVLLRRPRIIASTTTKPTLMSTRKAIEKLHILDGHEMKTGLKMSAASAMRMITLSASVLMMIILTNCDDDENNVNSARRRSKGPRMPNNIVAGDGFCGPQGGSSALGQASFNSGITTAKLDLDGNPLGTYLAC